MNKIYKVIWNKTRGMYMVVSELAKGQSKDGRRAVGRKKVAQTAAALAVFFSIVSMGGTSFAADTTVQDGAIVKADKTIGENVTNLDAALAKETAARLGADAAQDKVIQAVNDNLVQSVTTINKNVADGFTALSQADANEAAAREAGDNALDTRITNVKKYLEGQTADTYVSKTDATVQDGAIVKAANTIGENVTNLDAALTK